MTDLLGQIFTAQPLCRECDAPAYFTFNGSPLCVGHFNSSFAPSPSSSGDDVTAGVGQPPAVAPAVTDPLRNATALRVAANSGIQSPKFSSDISAPSSASA